MIQTHCTILIYGPEDEQEARLARQGADLAAAIWDFKEMWLWRKATKGEHNFKTADEALEATLNALMDELNERGIKLD